VNHFQVVDKALDLTALTEMATEKRFGAVASFLGTVRSPNGGAEVYYIDYEGYHGMIEKQMQLVADELRGRYSLGHIVISHRLGRILPGEASIAIVVSSRHRVDALAACQQCIDRCKDLLPIWKYEVTNRGSDWVPGHSNASQTL
jgi:molybdopterin synthase catalytic subunit